MNTCPKCQSSNTLEHTRLDDNRSYQWVPAIHCLKCGWYGYPKASDYEMTTGKVLETLESRKFPYSRPHWDTL